MFMMIIGRYLNIADRNLQIMQFLLEIGIFFGHFLVLGFPLAVGDFQGLDLAFVVTSLDISLAKPISTALAAIPYLKKQFPVGGYTSHWSHAGSCLLLRPLLQVAGDVSARLRSGYRAVR